MFVSRDLKHTGCETFLAALSSGDFPSERDSDGCIFIDRDPSIGSRNSEFIPWADDVVTVYGYFALS